MTCNCKTPRNPCRCDLIEKAAAEAWLGENPDKDMPHDRCRQASLFEQAERETLDQFVTSLRNPS